MNAPRSPLFRWTERVFWLAITAWIAVRFAPQVSAWTGIGADERPAPDISVVTIAGDPIDAPDLRGRVVVLSFWATWCLPCRIEMPALQKLHDRHAADGLVVLGLATDAHDREAIDAFLSERGIAFSIAPASPRLRAALGGVDKLPTTFIIDRAGVIRHEVVGLFAPPALAAAVGRLLRE